jgi:exodeoxyribonuclease V beta subunit
MAMRERGSFDISATAIVPQTTLLEASAGTGKTFTIEGLYLRLAIEIGVAASRILVCTFTKAATRELRARIRTRLRNARDELRSGQILDPALANCAQNPGEALRRAAAALADFDTAQIFTIHGFCSRVLSEHAFESGEGFDIGQTGEGARYARRSARDYARRTGVQAPVSSLCLALSGRNLEEDCFEAYRLRGADRDMPLRPEFEAWDDPAGMEKTIGGILGAIADSWRRESVEVLDFLRDKSRANAPLRNNADLVERAMNDLAKGSRPGAETTFAIGVLARAFIDDNCNKRSKQAAPHFEVSLFCDEFISAIDVVETTLVRGFMIGADAAIDEFCAAAGAIDYDGLLYKTARALRAGGESSLASVLRAKYVAGLVDEFQDTDSLQWEIFSRIFADERHYFYLIGDPKQSIYRFRGADVGSYLLAAERARNILTLGTNWRSDAPLVGAVNAVFSRTPRPFGEGIGFFPSRPSGAIDPARVFDPGPELAKEPLHFVVLGGDGPIGSAHVREQYLMANLCADIVALLTRGATIGTRPVEGGDIAVIVRTHAQAGVVRRALADVGVQAVEESDESVFDSEEAAAFSDLLAAALSRDDPREVKWVLSGLFFGEDAESLVALREDDAAWRGILDAFRDFSVSWEKFGVLRAFRELESRTGMRAKILSRPGGERVATNLLHVAELSGAAERGGKLDPAALCRWLDGMRLDETSRPKEGCEIRLESDAKAVRVLTGHKSKGLEFPIVFLPFLLERKKRDNRHYLLSRENGRRVLWIAPKALVPDGAFADDDRELREEEVRLLYVQLTRARSRCVAYLITEIVKDDAADLALPSVLGAADAKALVDSLEACAAQWPGAIAVERRHDLPRTEPLEPSGSSAELVRRDFAGTIDVREMLTSFSALHAAGESVGEAWVEAPDRSDFPARPSPEAALSGMAAFPRGAEAGTFLHACLERLDYSDEALWRGSIAAQMRIFGVDEAAWLDVVTKNLSDVVHTPLEASGPVLLGKKPLQVVREEEFYFPVRGVDTQKLAEAFARSGGCFARQAGEIAKIGARGVDGYLKGFIDLVFRDGGRVFLADWKSNWLGPDAASYAPERLEVEMARRLYFLQGCLYALAIDRSFSARTKGWDYERSFGGAYYVFLRGVDPARPGAGIVKFRPDRALLSGIAEALGCERSQP